MEVFLINLRFDHIIFIRKAGKFSKQNSNLRQFLTYPGLFSAFEKVILDMANSRYETSLVKCMLRWILLSLKFMRIDKAYLSNSLIFAYIIGLTFDFIPHCHSFEMTAQFAFSCKTDHLHLHEHQDIHIGDPDYSVHSPQSSHSCIGVWCFLECLLSETQHPAFGNSHYFHIGQATHFPNNCINKTVFILADLDVNGILNYKSVSQRIYPNIYLEKVPGSKSPNPNRGPPTSLI